MISLHFCSSTLNRGSSCGENIYDVLTFAVSRCRQRKEEGLASVRMERTHTQESCKSQDTEAPLSDGAYDLLVDEIQDESILYHASCSKKEDPSEGHEQTPVFTSNGLPFPDYSNSLLQQFEAPPLVRSYSCERWNRVPPHPSRNEFRGLYDFRVLFEETPKISKSMPWTFSRKLIKLFCNINAAVPIQFHFGAGVPPGAYVRALLVGHDDTTVIIKTCPKHVEELKQNGTVTHPYHIMQCGRRSHALYGICNETGKYSLRFPILPLQAGVTYQSQTFAFSCYSSCLRREIDAIFTLEINGEVFGRQSFSVRVCACPGRDRKSQENKRKRSIVDKITSSDSDGNRKKRLTDSKVEKPLKKWVIAVSTHKRYKLLKKLNKSLEIYDGGEGEFHCGEAIASRVEGGWSYTVEDKKKNDREEEQK